MRTLSHHFNFVIRSLRGAFVGLVPYLVGASFAVLMFNLLLQLGFYPPNTAPWLIIGMLQSAFPILVVCAVAYHLGKPYEIDPLVAILLALCVFFSAQALNAAELRFDSLNALLAPLISTGVLAYFVHRNQWSQPKYAVLNQNLLTIYQYTPVFIVSFAISFVLLYVVDEAVFLIINVMSQWFSFNEWSTEMRLALRTIASPLLFFIGLHGSIVMDFGFGNAYLNEPIFTQLSAKTFYDLFVILGGAGASLALAIAILFNGEDKHAIKTTKIALPFLAFNISEIILYGLPVILNRRLLIPFVLAPTINFFLAYLVVVKLGWLSFNGHAIAWTTPIFINGYLASDHSLGVMLLQACLLLIDIKLYLLFVKPYVKTQNSSARFERLRNALNIAIAVETKQQVKFEEAQSYIVNSHIKTHEIVEIIAHNQLLVYYQPKIELQHQQCDNLEALLRLRLKDGRVIGPDFLTVIERAGLSPIIDLWVCQQVQTDLNLWQQQGFFPKVSINIHPDTLNEKAYIDKIMQLLPADRVELEFIEKALISSDEAFSNLQSLKSAGYAIAVDDFGSGYSALNSLNNIPANTIKLDKQLIDHIDSDNGKIMYKHIVQMCLEMGFITVSEGVETQTQATFAQDAGVNYIQGWYYSPALPFERVKPYAEAFGKT